MQRDIWPFEISVREFTIPLHRGYNILKTKKPPTNYYILRLAILKERSRSYLMSLKQQDSPLILFVSSSRPQGHQENWRASTGTPEANCL